MKTLLPAALLASLAVAQPAISQPARFGPMPLIEDSCSLANLFEDDGGSSRAKYAAVVGVMSQDPAVHQKLLPSKSARMCAHAASSSLCASQIIKFTITFAQSMFPSSKLIDVMTAADLAKDPAKDPNAVTGGIMGAVIGGGLGAALSKSTLGGAVTGAAVGGGIGMGIGTWLDSGKPVAACEKLQSDFTDITAAMMLGGLGPQADADAMIATVQRVAARQGSPKQKETMSAMVEVMEATAYRIEQSRNR